MRFFRLLSFKLFLIVLFVLTILTVGFSVYYIKTESEQYEQIARQCANRASEIISHSTRNSMLQNQKQDTYEIILSIVQQDAIEKICIYDKFGKIVYSTSENEIGQIKHYTEEACAACHESSGSIKPSSSDVWYRTYYDENKSRFLGYIKLIKNEPACYNADCHAHPSDMKYLGVLDVVMSLKTMDELSIQNQAQLISTNIIITLLLGLIVGAVIWFLVHVPVKKLILGTKQISSGNLEYKIDVHGKNEIGLLANSFNDMTNDLNNAKKEITKWSNRLEQRVVEKTEELEKTQKRNLQIEKMASLGQLSATVAHELNNPMAGILTYSKLIQKKLNKDFLSENEKQEILKYLKMIESESQRSGDIVKNMLLFSRQEAIEIKPQKINDIIDDSIELISHHLKLNNIQLKKEYQSDLPLADIDENQIKQALLALCVNSVEAMEGGGSLTVKTEYVKATDKIRITITDTGKGIPEDVKAHIFEPFFTTKSAVKGVGLGLSSVYAIVNRHEGEIRVESEINKGTAFIIELPVKKSKVLKS